MFPDGICRVTDNYYTKTVQFQDINYQLNQNEDKMAIFDGWCDFLNYFDSSIRFQFSFVNQATDRNSTARNIMIPAKGDAFDSIRAEYTEMLQNQLARGNNGLMKTKYLTFGIEADNLKTAKPRLERIETDVLNNFKRLGVQAGPMNGTERLKLLHGVFHLGLGENHVPGLLKDLRGDVLHVVAVEDAQPLQSGDAQEAAQVAQQAPGLRGEARAFFHIDAIYHQRFSFTALKALAPISRRQKALAKWVLSARA